MLTSSFPFRPLDQNNKTTKQKRSYALDVNLASLDVLNHKRLLDSARADPSAVSFQVRPVDVALSTATAAASGGGSILMRPASMSADRSSGGGNGGNNGGLDRAPSFSASDSLLAEAAAAGARAARPRANAAALPRPAFGSSPNLQALVLEAEAADARPEAAFYEVTIASVDQPKLLSRLSEALVSWCFFFFFFSTTKTAVVAVGEEVKERTKKLTFSFFSSTKPKQGDLNLNICEAHAFNTLDRFSLDVFVVNGWAGETADELEDVLSERLAQLPPPGANSPPRGGAGAANASANAANADSQQPGVGTLTPIGGGASPAGTSPSGGGGGGGSLADGGNSANTNGLVPTSALPRPPPPPDDFELDAAEVVCHERVAAGAFGDLYRGTYCGTDVAVKILRNVATDTAQFAEFLQEVHIMRKVRHRNVVQFIGACTQRPNLCIVFEYLPGELVERKRERKRDIFLGVSKKKNTKKNSLFFKNLKKKTQQKNSLSLLKQAAPSSTGCAPAALRPSSPSSRWAPRSPAGWTTSTSAASCTAT